MNRREMISKTGMLAAALGLAGMTVGCTKKTLVSYAEIALSFLEQTLPYFQDLLPGSIGTLNSAIIVVKDLIDALKKESTGAVDLIKQLIAPDGLFLKILDDVHLITDANKRKLVSGILAIAGVALNLISAFLTQSAPPAMLAKAKSTESLKKISESNVLERALAALKY